MSRQFDEYMADKFEIHGEQYELVEPQNFEELLKAIEVKEAIRNYYSALIFEQ